MKRHASMNRVYRVIWSKARGAWMAVGETVKGRGKGSGSRKLLAAALLLSAAGAQAGPTGGQVAGGTGSIAKSGTTTTITQSSQNLWLNWKSFNVGAQETVNFLQPSASAIAVNRIFDTNGTQILGHLNANGQVWLINPNGILFGRGAQVNVGGLVASTLDLNDATLNGNARSFGGGGTGSVVNRGTINAAEGGYVALLGNQVSNQGTIVARLGTVALGAGSAATLSFAGSSLVKMQVDQSVLNSVAKNGGLISADGGTVLMTAGAKNALLASVVNNTGVIQARTVENREGVITLLGGMAAGTAKVGGTLDASAPSGGNGGFIETSAAHVKVANDAKVTTAATNGKSGTWLIDPVDFTIAASGGDISGATLSGSLGTGDIVIESSGGATAGNGDINVNDAVSWSANKLTLTAARDINVNAVMTASGTSQLEMNTAAANGLDAGVAGGTVRVGINADGSFKGRVDFPGRSGPGFLTINGNGYTVIDSLGAEGSTTPLDLQGMNGGLAGFYALGANIDASATAGWNAGEGFAPVGDAITPFTGMFDGLGHSISKLSINRPSASGVGLFGNADVGAEIRNVGLVGASVKGQDQVGALVGANNYGTISNSYATGTVSGALNVGGLVGFNYGTISNSYATGNVSGALYVGGLAGFNYGAISNSYATGGVSGVVFVGGLVGLNYGGAITNSYATGNVSGALYVGGLVGTNYGTIDNSYATGSVSGSALVGGLVGSNYGAITNSYATGSVSGSSYVGGLVGLNYGAITNSYATGSVTGGELAGGLVGLNYGAITNSYATGSVSGSNYVGGLVGINEGTGTIANSYAIGNVSGNSYVGGLVGGNYGAISTSYAAGSVSGSSNVGGLVGFNDATGTISGSYWNSEVNPSLSGVGSGDGSGATGLTTVQMRSASSFTDFTFTTTPGASGNNWVIVNGDGSLNSAGTEGGGTMPMLASEYSTTVNNAHQLQLMAMDLGASYTLGRNIDASRTGTGGDVWGGGGFVPVGNSGTNFTGSFDGLGRSIDGLSINRPSANFVGLFGVAGAPATIQNVGLVGGSVSGSYYAGGLVGMNYGTITNSYATGNVSGALYVGGLVGTNNVGTISNSYATGSVIGSSSIVGGLVGYNRYGSISNSYATGSVSGGGDFVGGLAGSNNGTISNSYATGDVIGNNSVGGLVGSNYGGINYGTISNSYATGSVSGNNNVGGLVGGNYGAISTSYAAGSVSGSSNVGGLVGFNDATGTISGSYWNSEVNLSLSGVGSGDGSGAAGLSTVQMRSASSFTDFTFTTTPGASGNNWVIVNGDGSLNSAGTEGGGTMPMLASEYSTTVNNAHQMQLMAMDLGASYTLGRNIDASRTGTGGDVWGSAGFVPVGNSTTKFTGAFDGQGRTIGDLVINRPGTDNVGLFGWAGGTSVIRNVGLVGGSATGTNYVGGLVGVSEGTINNSYATGSVTGSSYVGGLVGSNYLGTVSNSYATGSVYGSWVVGGLVGQNHGTVSNSYAAGNVYGDLRVGGLVGSNYGMVSNSYATGSASATIAVGGLVGYNYGGAVENSYASGNASGAINVGGLVGENRNGGTISNSYWNTDASGSTGVADGDATGATGLTGTAMQSQGSFGGWDFASTWVMYEGYSNPLLRSLMTPLTVMANSGNKIYNRQVYAGENGVSYSSTPNGNLLGTLNYDSGGAINVGFYTVRPGGLYSNQQGYVISYLDGALAIDPAPLTVTGTVVRSKVYDTTTTASLRRGVLNGVYADDTVTLIQEGIFASPNAGAGITVYANDSLDGASAGNYYVIQPTGLSGYIAKAPLTVTDTVVSNKIYDGGTRATLSEGVLQGVYGVDAADVVLIEVGRFVSKNAGTGVAVTAIDRLAGLSAGNYRVVQPTGLTADITPRNIFVSGLTASDKVYDATTDAVLGGSAALSAPRGTDDVFLGAGTAVGQFVNKNAGANKAVIVSGITLDGADAGNYNLVQRVSRASISKADLEVTGITAKGKVYDGTTSARLLGTATVTALNTDEVTVGGLRSGAFDDPNVGTGKAVAASGFVLRGADARNYNIVQPSGLTANILQARLTYVATPATFTLGTDPTGLVTGTVSGFFLGDNLLNSTGGSVVWTTNATGASGLGSYYIYGGGLTSTNYKFAQDPANATALTIGP